MNKIVHFAIPLLCFAIAAGTGLNVTGANHVIHYSRHWNPAKEGQATDRAYRIGQTKDVYVYYPMAVSPNFQALDITLISYGTKMMTISQVLFRLRFIPLFLCCFKNNYYICSIDN